MSDKWLLGFITLWIVLTAGNPDLLDAITDRVSGKYEYQQHQQFILKEKQSDN